MENSLLLDWRVSDNKNTNHPATEAERHLHAACVLLLQKAYVHKTHRSADPERRKIYKQTAQRPPTFSLSLHE